VQSNRRVPPVPVPFPSPDAGAPVRGPRGQVLVRGVEVRSPRRQVLVRGVEVRSPRRQVLVRGAEVPRPPRRRDRQDHKPDPARDHSRKPAEGHGTQLRPWRRPFFTDPDLCRRRRWKRANDKSGLGDTSNSSHHLCYRHSLLNHHIHMRRRNNPKQPIRYPKCPRDQPLDPPVPRTGAG